MFCNDPLYTRYKKEFTKTQNKNLVGGTILFKIKNYLTISERGRKKTVRLFIKKSSGTTERLK